ncbi:GTPase-activating protein S13 [Kluyveromyces marxianus]|nr:GTPase-activating protein S13 [Kluyveromyces marxianus]
MVAINNAHTELIHDAVLDYYGKRLATCSSDHTIKIFEVDGETHKLIDTLQGHEGPVWQVDWAHPKFGVILASCSYDGKVLIWKEVNGRWSQIAAHEVHSASVNSIQWAPHEYGPLLLAASSDGKVFVTGGADNLVKIWRFNPEAATYLLEHTLEGHSDWVRDVAWSPTVLSRSYLASVSQDRTCIIWTQDNNEDTWKKTLLKEDKFPDVLWRASWSLSGNILALSCGDNTVTLWKENLEGKWEPAGQVTE